MQHQQASLPIRGQILQVAARLALADRERDYGDPLETMTLFNQLYAPIVAADLPAPVQGALIMVMLKLARVLRNPNHIDTWTDMAAYVAIAGECAVRTSKTQ